MNYRQALFVAVFGLLVWAGSATVSAATTVLPTTQAGTEQPAAASRVSGGNASQSALAVSPAITEQILTPGTAQRLTLRVTNITRVPLPIKGSIKNLTPEEALLPATDRSVYDASAWFTLEPADFILQPNQTKEIAVTILPPQRATPGGHYATVYFQPLVPQEALTPSTAYLNARVGVLSLLIVKGDIVERAALDDVQVPRLSQFGPIALTLPIRNNGNTHVLPQGDVTVRDWRGRQVSKQAIPTGLVLPGTQRQYKLSWNNHGRSGYFTAQATLTYGDDKTRLQSGTVWFVILPWVPIVSGTLVLVLGGVFIAKTHSRWKAAWQVFKSDKDEK